MKEQAKVFLKQHAHLAKVKRFSWIVVTDQQPAGTYGAVDYKPFTGNIFACDEDFVGVKRGRESFLIVIDRHTLPNHGQDLVPGMKITVTPYARHTFDGRRLDGIVEEEIRPEGITVRKFTLNPKVEIPVPEAFKEHINLMQMVEQLEHIKSEKTGHTCAQMLADAGLSNPQIPEILDDQYGPEGLRIRFHINNQKACGIFEFKYNYATDSYFAKLIGQEGNVLSEVDDFYFDQMAEVVESMVDDHNWAIAKVEVLKRAA